MEIIVQGQKIETKEICRIVDIEHYKTMFMNRQAGFIVERINKPSISFWDPIPYEASGYQASCIREKWSTLRAALEAKWNEDKSDIPALSLS